MIRSGLVFRIPRCGFRVPGQLDSRCQWNLDYGFLQLNSGFTKFGIPDSISRNVPDSGFLKQRFLDSRIRISLHGARLQLYAGGCDRPSRPYSPLSHHRWFHMTDAIAGTLLKTNWKSRQSWAIITSLNSVQSWCSCGVLRRRYTILVYFQTGKFKGLLNTLLPFFSIWQRCWNAGVVCGLPVSWYWPQGHHKFFPGVFGGWNHCFCLFTGSVLLCAILFKLKICLFAFCFVFFVCLLLNCVPFFTVFRVQHWLRFIARRALY